MRTFVAKNQYQKIIVWVTVQVWSAKIEPAGTKPGIIKALSAISISTQAAVTELFYSATYFFQRMQSMLTY